MDRVPRAECFLRRLRVERCRGSLKFRSKKFWKGIELAPCFKRDWMNRSALPLVRGMYGMVRMYINLRTMQAWRKALEMVGAHRMTTVDTLAWC